jgi:hypothetical protein
MNNWMNSLVLLALIFVHSNSKAESTDAPPILQSFLRNHSEYHLVTITDFNDEEKREAFVHQDEGGGFHSAVFRVMDTNRDGLKDVVAVVVKNGLFNAFVLQATQNGFSSKPFWLIRDSQETLAGVFFDKGDYIVLNNLDCCYTPWVFGWTGTNYELGIELPGSYVCINPQTAIYPEAKIQSAPLFTIKEKVGATVVKIGMKQDGDRWYKIKLREKDARMGYLLSRDLLDITDCAELTD